MDVPNSTTSTILAVDDTPTNLSVLAELLKDRYRVRVEEMRQSLRIIEQAVKQLPSGPVRAEIPQVVRPPAGEAPSSGPPALQEEKPGAGPRRT